MVIKLDDYHRNIRGKTGKELTDDLILLVEDERWKNKKPYYFYDFDQQGSNELPDELPYSFMIRPVRKNLQTIQTGNGVVTFLDSDSQEFSPGWSDLQPTVQDDNFSDTFKNYMYKNHNVSGMNFLVEKENGRNVYNESHACVLLSFEIARRVEIPFYDGTHFRMKYPITRSMTERAIRRVMSSSEEEYAVKVDDQMQMFKGRFQDRFDAYQRIMNPSVGDISQSTQNIDLQTTQH